MFEALRVFDNFKLSELFQTVGAKQGGAFSPGHMLFDGHLIRKTQDLVFISSCPGSLYKSCKYREQFS